MESICRLHLLYKFYLLKDSFEERISISSSPSRVISRTETIIAGCTTESVCPIFSDWVIFDVEHEEEEEKEGKEDKEVYGVESTESTGRWSNRQMGRQKSYLWPSRVVSKILFVYFSLRFKLLLGFL